LEVRRIDVRDARMLVVARGLTGPCLPGALWWKTSVVVGSGAETRVEGIEGCQSCAGEWLHMGLGTTEPPSAGCDGCCEMLMAPTSGCCAGCGAGTSNR